MNWQAEATKAIQAFDEALGRPPFPQQAASELLDKANIVFHVMTQIVDAGRLKALEGVAEVTTTLPILCASLREGSPNHQPCLALYRPILLATGLASSLSTYPISHILSDAKCILGSALYGNDSGASSGVERNADCTKKPAAVTHNERDNASDDAAATASSEAALFTFMATTHSLTPNDMRRFLRLPVHTSDSAPTSNNKSKGKSKSGSVGLLKGAERAGAASSSNSTAKGGSKAAASVAGSTTDVPKAVVDAMLGASLTDDCRHVFESFFDNTQKFLDMVGCDGDLAGRILAVYGARVVAKLKPSSLLPCLNAALLDYFVDIVAGSFQGGGLGTLLTSKELREVPLKTWDVGRMRELACYAASRTVRPEEAMASLVVYTFLYMIYSELADRGGGATVALPSSFTGDDGQTEDLFMRSILRAAHAVLLANKMDKTTTMSLQAYAEANTGIVVVCAAGVPRWLEPLASFAQLLLARRTAVSRLLSAPPHRDRGGGEGGSDEFVEEAEESVQLLVSALCDVLDAVTNAAPKAQRTTVVSSAERQQPSTQTSRTRKPKGKQSDSTKGGEKGHHNNSSGNATATASETSGKTVSAAEQAVAPAVSLGEVLASCCSTLLFAELLSRSVRSSSTSFSPSECSQCQLGMLADVVHSYSYLLQYQPQRLNAALWQPFLALFAYCMWEHVSSGVDAVITAASNEVGKDNERRQFKLTTFTPMNALADVLSSATASTNSMLWLSPVVLPSRSTASPAKGAAAKMGQLLLARESALWLAVVQAAVNAHNTTKQQQQTMPFFLEQLFPAPPAFVLGALCSAIDDEVLQTLAGTVVSSAAGRGSVIIAGLQRLHESCRDWTALSSASVQSCFLSRCVPAVVPESGLKRLLDIIAILQAGHEAMLQAAETDAKEAARRTMQDQLQRSHELAAAHEAFLTEAQEKRARKAAEQEVVHAEVERRRAAAAARFSEDAAARARKRQSALETLRRRAAQTAAHRDEVRRQRFAAYQQRLQSEYRVATFLEHLNLPSARVVATRDALRNVIDTITPDDLLEFLVSGEAKVPSDMQDEGGEEEEEEEEEDLRMSATAAASAALQPAAPIGKEQARAPLYSGERRDFWAEIMDNAVPSAPSAPSSTVRPLPPPSSSSAPAVPSTFAQNTPAEAAAPPPSQRSSVACRKQSFHKRVSPLLDLFFYEDGDEYGNVPDVMPSVRLRVAANVWPSARTQVLGFANLREAFDQMKQRGIVQVHGGVVQLTLLGFRYHFPFHDPDGMLEVYLREARERVRALMAAKRCSSAAAVVEEMTGEAEGDVDGEYDEEVEEDEEEEEVDDNAGRLLPEVEFGI